MRKRGSLLITLGVLLLAAALGLTAYNLYEDHRAAVAADQVTVQLKEVLPEPQPQQPSQPSTPETVIPDYILNPHMDMPEIEIDGEEYIGTLSLPSLDIELPIISHWSYPRLRIAPCRYVGSAYTDDLVIAAHNYNYHFGQLKNLNEGERVVFTDTDGNVFTYEVAARETLMPTAVEEMTSGEWDLTLFTCTLGGSYRVTVRCDRINAE